MKPRRHLAIVSEPAGAAPSGAAVLSGAETTGAEAIAADEARPVGDAARSAVGWAPADSEELTAPSGAAELGDWDEESLLQVGELAKATGKTVRAIHLYESLGLLTPIRRSKGRYRLFAPDAKLRIKWIGKLQSLGLSLPDIQALMQQRAASDSARRAAKSLETVYADKLAEVRETLLKYQELERELTASLAFLNRCTSSCEHEAAAANCSTCSTHQAPGVQTPDLVAGASLRLSSGAYPERA